MCLIFYLSLVVRWCFFRHDSLEVVILNCPGACGGELACSTCHLVFDEDVYARLPPMEDEEEDMLDLAFELTET